MTRSEFLKMIVVSPIAVLSGIKETKGNELEEYSELYIKPVIKAKILSSNDDYYNGAVVCIDSKYHVITDYDGATKTFTVDGGDTFGANEVDETMMVRCV